VRLHFALPDLTERGRHDNPTVEGSAGHGGISAFQEHIPRVIALSLGSHRLCERLCRCAWIVSKLKRHHVFDHTERTIPANYSKLAKSKKVIIDKEDYDVFGDGRVVLMFTPGPHARPSGAVSGFA
jgi:hypothetical protein